MLVRGLALRVLTVSSSFPRYTGDYQGGFIYSLCRKLSERGVDVTVLAPRSRSAGIVSGVKVKRFPFMPFSRLETISEQTIKQASTGDLIQLPSYLLSAYLSILGEHMDIIHAHLTIPMGFLSSLPPNSRPLIVTCHGSDCTLPLDNSFYRPFVRRVLRRTEKVVAVWDFIKRLALSLGAPNERVETVYLGVDAEKFKPLQDKEKLKETLGVPTGKLIIGTLGRLAQEKRIEDLIQAAAWLNDKLDSHFLIGGEGPARHYLERLARKLKVNNITFLGEVKDAPRFHQLCDIFVLASVREGLSISLQEAMATGCVPVATNGFGCSELVRDGENGFLFKARDVGELSRKVLEAAENLKMGRLARRTIQERFDTNSAVGRYLELYEELASTRRIQA